MQIEFQQSSAHPERPPFGVPCAVLLLLVTGLACGDSPDEAIEPLGCTLDDCASSGEQCIVSACVAPAPSPSTDVGRSACSVVECPASMPRCCTAAAVTAMGNESQGYASRNHMVSSANALGDEVRAVFSFDAAGQQGWVAFDLRAEIRLDSIDFTGSFQGATDQFLSVNTNRSDDSGCAFGFELEPRSAAPGEGPPLLGDDIFFNDRDFCYGDAAPGSASQLAFAIFSTEPGEAELIISNITLRD